MIRRLMVPLDGSKLAEEVLPIAAELARAVDGTIDLVRVVPPVVSGRSYAPNVLEQLEQHQTDEARAYLDSMASSLSEQGLRAETKLLQGEVAPTLARLAASEQCDLIVMSSHGLGGLGFTVFGSVAQKLLHAASCPVLVARPTAAGLEREEELEERRADEALLSELPRVSAGRDNS